MYRKILVPVDGSDISEQCLNQAIRLAKEQGAQLRVIYVIDDLVTDTLQSPEALEEFLRATREMGENVLEAAKAKGQKAGVKTSTRLIEIAIFGDRVAQMIVKEAESWPTDLIVMGTHGRRGLSHFFMGSVAEGVLRSTRRQVLLIPATSGKAAKGRSGS